MMSRVRSTSEDLKWLDFVEPAWQPSPYKRRYVYVVPKRLIHLCGGRYIVNDKVDDTKKEDVQVDWSSLAFTLDKHVGAPWAKRARYAPQLWDLDDLRRPQIPSE